MERVDLKKQEMYTFIRSCISSGEKPYSYCKKHKMNYGSYRYWLAKYKLDLATSGSEKQIPFVKSSSFISLDILSSPSVSSTIQVQYPNGVSLHLDSTITTDQLRKLITILSCSD